jgi:Scaffold protein Nfu/NifU N terminal
MGQPVAVTEKPSSRPGLVRFELNRSLTGMGHERYTAADQIVGDKTSAELARRLFATDKVDAVHIYQNVVTVDLKEGYTADGLADVVENLYIYWVPGREVPVLEAPAEEAPAAAAPAPTEGAPVSAAASRVPAHLLERSRAALERARAKAAEG